MLYGAVIDSALAWSIAGAPVFEARLGYWLGLLYLSLIASSLAFFLYYRVIRAIGPARAAYSSVLIPIIAMGFSTLLENYHWAPLALAGGVLALMGLVIALGSRPPAVPAPAD
jgi:drug/metabolite transporter (DMT)-like permease